MEPDVDLSPAERYAEELAALPLAERVAALRTFQLHAMTVGSGACALVVALGYLARLVMGA